MMTSNHLTASDRTLSTRNDRPIPRKESMMDHSTPTSLVSAFCRAVISQLVPNEFWGVGEVQNHNISIIHRNIDRFVKLRRFESLSLHEVTQGLKVSSDPTILDRLTFLDQGNRLVGSRGTFTKETLTHRHEQAMGDFQRVNLLSF